MSKLAIVCDGKEISHGLGLLHLFQFKNDDEKFMSKRGEDLSAEIYTVGSFKSTWASKNSICIFVNNDLLLSSAKSVVFNEDGIQIYKDENKYAIFSNSESLEKADYNGFVVRANKKRNEYCELEKEYVNRLNSLGVNWLPGNFSVLSPKGFFGKNKFLKDMLQQQYDYATYLLYLMI